MLLWYFDLCPTFSSSGFVIGHDDRGNCSTTHTHMSDSSGDPLMDISSFAIEWEFGWDLMGCVALRGLRALRRPCDSLSLPLFELGLWIIDNTYKYLASGRPISMSKYPWLHVDLWPSNASIAYLSTILKRCGNYPHLHGFVAVFLRCLCCCNLLAARLQ